MSPESWIFLKGLSDLGTSITLIILMVWVYIKIKGIEKNIKSLKSGDKT